MLPGVTGGAEVHDQPLFVGGVPEGLAEFVRLGDGSWHVSCSLLTLSPHRAMRHFVPRRPRAGNTFATRESTAGRRCSPADICRRVSTDAGSPFDLPALRAGLKTNGSCALGSEQGLRTLGGGFLGGDGMAITVEEHPGLVHM